MLLLCCSASSPSSRPVDDDTADDDDDDDDVSSEAVETGAVALVSSVPLPRRLDPVEEEEDVVVETTAVITSTSDGLIDIGIDCSSWTAMLSVGITSSDEDICIASSSM